MGEALMGGLIASGFSKPELITVADIREDRLNYLKEQHNVNATTDNKKTVGENDIVVFAVKPQTLPDILEDVAPSIGPDTLVISIAAGVTISAIAGSVKARIVRAMPNMCAQVRQSVTAVCGNPAVTEEDFIVVERLFDSVGITVRVSEDKMDAVTAVSGSGPAYIFLIMEALIEAGVENGLTLGQSRVLVEHTVKGAAELSIETNLHPAELKERIMSPQGTTVAALHVLEEAGLRGTILSAVAAAYKRSKELGA